MAQSVDEILAQAKKTLSDANQKFPSPASPAPAASAKPSYAQAHEARKTPSMNDELATKKTMVDKANQALK